MSRVIKFRGYTEFAPKWHYGYYVKNQANFSFIRSMDDFETYWVDEKTVGLFTTLPDKNGKEIYQGDICKIRFNPEEVSNDIYVLLTDEEIRKGERIFVVKSPLFNNQVELFCGDIEIIGNIHQNPELLKKKDEPSSN